MSYNQPAAFKLLITNFFTRNSCPNKESYVKSRKESRRVLQMARSIGSNWTVLPSDLSLVKLKISLNHTLPLSIWLSMTVNWLHSTIFPNCPTLPSCNSLTISKTLVNSRITDDELFHLLKNSHISHLMID